jgi:hypothetical protein
VIILHPQNSCWSAAYGTWCGQQAGYATVSVGDNLEDHAALWSGTAESWVDLHPAGSTYSGALAVSDGQQVGRAGFGVHTHASLWSGTADSWVDLHPTGIENSDATCIAGGYQAGVVNNGSPRAALWHGTADSWVDLHSFLSADYSWSRADAIEVDGSDIWVVGVATKSVTTGSEVREAVMWHTVVPEPSSLLFLATGLLALPRLIRTKRR